MTTKNKDEFLIPLKDNWRTVRVSVINYYFRTVWAVTRFDGNGNVVVRFDIENTEDESVASYEKYDSALEVIDRYVSKCRETGDWS
jgi:hypothetical protein